MPTPCRAAELRCPAGSCWLAQHNRLNTTGSRVGNGILLCCSNRLMALGAANRSAASVLRRAPTMARTITQTLISTIQEQDGLFTADSQQAGGGSCAVTHEVAMKAAGSAGAAGSANGMGLAEAQV